MASSSSTSTSTSTTATATTLESVLGEDLEPHQVQDVVTYLKSKEIVKLAHLKGLPEAEFTSLLAGINPEGRRNRVRQLLAPYIEAMHQNKVLDAMEVNPILLFQDLPKKELPHNFFNNLNTTLAPINSARLAGVVTHDNVLELVSGFIAVLSSDLPDVQVHYASKSKTHDTIKDGNATDIVVSVPLLEPITYPGGQKTRQATFGGEGKILFELNNNSGPDHKQIPSGALRGKDGARSSCPLKGSSHTVPKGGPAQILQRAYEFFTNNPNENDYRGFFTDAINWFFCLVRHTDEADHFYITDLFVFDLTSYDGTIPLNTNVCDAMHRHLLWVQETFTIMKARAEAVKLYKPPLETADIKAGDINVVVENGVVYSFPIVRKLGTGRSSIIYECWSDFFAMNVCVKCEPNNDSVQLVNEFQTLQTLKGIPGVPCVLLCGCSDEYLVLVTSVVGIPITTQDWTKKELQTFWTLAFHTIECIHRRGIVITDIKPEHLILSSSGLYLVDYGCAYPIQRGRRVALLYFDPLFASRQEFTKLANPGYESDFESLAFSFYYLCHKSLPWIDASQTRTIRENELQRMKSELVGKIGDISASGEWIVAV